MVAIKRDVRTGVVNLYRGRRRFVGQNAAFCLYYIALGKDFWSRRQSLKRRRDY